MKDWKIKKQHFEARRQLTQLVPITCYFLDAWLEHRHDPPILREAYALSNLWHHCVKPVQSDELIVGTLAAREPVGFHYGSGTWIDQDMVGQYRARLESDRQSETDLTEALELVNQQRYHAADSAVFNQDQLKSIEAHAATSTWFGGHIVIDFAGAVTLGLSAWRDLIEQGAQLHPQEAEFYQAMHVILRAIDGFIAGYAVTAAHINPQAALDLEYIRQKPPATFRQGLQLVWILHLLNGADSFGRFDQYLWPLLQQDLAQNNLSPDDAYELLVSFWLKIEEVGAIQNMTLGGCDQRGAPAYNQLTQLCLQVTADVGYKGPNLCLRVRPDMPEAVSSEALRCLGSGLGLPAMYNDQVYVNNLLRSGIPLSEANDYCLAGCSQVVIPGRSNFYNDIGILNAAKILEITLHGGIDPRSGEQVGLRTLPAADMTSFDQLLAAWYKQAEYFCQLEVDIHERELAYRRSREGYALRTFLTRDCLATGRSVYHGGARYNNVQLEIIGLTNVADSLAAIRSIVFTQRKCSFRNLIKALDNNYQDQLPLRNMLLSVPKFGNDDAETDDLRARITSHLYAWFNRTPAGLGGHYVPGEVIFTAHEYAGKVTGATPDGRLAGQVLADSAGAMQGMDLHGPTALVNSMLTLPADQYLITSAVLNICFLQSLFADNSLRLRVRSLIDTYFRRGGGQVQINVFDVKALLAARQEPEKYRSLVVRVGGYSEYFVNLSPALQEELILRTGHSC